MGWEEVSQKIQSLEKEIAEYQSYVYANPTNCDESAYRTLKRKQSELKGLESTMKLLMEQDRFAIERVE